MGFWNDKNIPCFALFSVFRSDIFLPLKYISPEDILHMGFPIIVWANVLLPEPFLPIRTCISPLRISRLMLFNIRLFSISTDSSLTLSILDI